MLTHGFGARLLRGKIPIPLGIDSQPAWEVFPVACSQATKGIDSYLFRRILRSLLRGKSYVWIKSRWGLASTSELRPSLFRGAFSSWLLVRELGGFLKKGSEFKFFKTRDVRFFIVSR